MSVEHAIELALDAQAADECASLMAALERAGVPPLSTVSPHVHPHVSVAVASDGAPDDLAHLLAGLGAVAEALPTVTLSSLGAFVAPARVVFLGVTVTEPLLALNRAVHERLASSQVTTRSLYHPAHWVPHCTLAMHVADLSAAMAALDGARLPIEARVVSMGVVEVPTGKVVAQVC